MTESTQKTRVVKPYSRPAALAKLDQRTKEARVLREIREELTHHVGNNPSATQRALIDQAAQLKLRLAVMDRTFAENNKTTGHDTRDYLAWANSYTRLLRQLGIKGTTDRALNLNDYLAARDTPGGPQAAAKASNHPSEAPAP